MKYARQTLLIAMTGFAVVGHGALVTTAATAFDGRAIRVRLRSDCTVSRDVVTLGDLADIRGEDAATVQQLTDLDVTILSPQQSSETIPRERLLIRLLIAGVASEAVEISGPETVTVRRLTPAIARAGLDAMVIESAARESMALALGLPEQDIAVRLSTPLDLPSEMPASHVSNSRIDVLPPPRPTPGRVRMTVRLFSGETLAHTVSGLFDVRVRQTVPVASTDLPQGTVVTADHVTTREQWGDRMVQTAGVSQLIDRPLRQSVVTGEVLTATAVGPAATSAVAPVIKARDLVRVTARRGTLTVILPAAEALQAGVPGELIRVRNLDSRKLITGRVVSAGEVEVLLD